MEKLLSYLIEHNVLIIEILIVTVGIVALLFAIKLFLRPPESNLAGGLSAELEQKLRELIEKSNGLAQPANSGSGSETATAQSQLFAEIQTLKAELESKNAEILNLQAQGPASAGSVQAGNSALEDKIKELQSKLEEYEIISEDIADLSKYREENQKLKKELESLKLAPTPTVAPTPTAEPAVAPSAPAAQPPPPAASPPAPTPASEAVAPEVAATQNEVAGASSEVSAVDDELMAEFAAAVEAQKKSAPADPGINSQDINLDQLLSEAATIPEAQGEVSIEAALGTSLDESKLESESLALQGGPSEEEKLLGDFENFIKKEKGS